jgi:hypothetical protein
MQMKMKLKLSTPADASQVEQHPPKSKSCQHQSHFLFSISFATHPLAAPETPEPLSRHHRLVVARAMKPGESRATARVSFRNAVQRRRN